MRRRHGRQLTHARRRHAENQRRADALPKHVWNERHAVGRCNLVQHEAHAEAKAEYEQINNRQDAGTLRARGGSPRWGRIVHILIRTIRTGAIVAPRHEY